jgi:hypothetical protein
MWKRHVRHIESQETAYLAPTVSFFPAYFEKILRAVLEIGSNLAHVVFINGDIFRLLTIGKLVPINVAIDFVRPRPPRVIANTAEPGFTVYSARQDEFGSRKFSVELLVHQGPWKIFKTVVLLCNFQQFSMAIIDPQSETLARPRLVFQAKMFQAGTKGRGPGFMKTDSQDLHARFPGVIAHSWVIGAIRLLAKLLKLNFPKWMVMQDFLFKSRWILLSEGFVE